MVDVAKPLLYCFDSPISITQGGAGAEYRRQSSTPEPGAMILKALPDLAIDLSGLFNGL